MHIQLITADEHDALLKVHTMLTELASGERLPAHPDRGICFQMSAEVGVQRGTKLEEYPQSYHDFGTGLYKLFCHSYIMLHPDGEALMEEDELDERKKFTSADFTSFCCRTFKGFELNDDYCYPIPDSRAGFGNGSMWDGYNGARRRLLCGHMAEVLGERLDYLNEVYGLRYNALAGPQRNSIQLMRNAIAYLRYNTPKAPTTGVCFKATELASIMSRHLPLNTSDDPARALKHVAIAVLRDALAYKQSEERTTVLLDMLQRIHSSDNGIMCKFVGIVAYCKLPLWFADREHQKVSHLIDYPVPGGQATYCDTLIDNWEGEQLRYRQQLMDKLLMAIDSYTGRE